MLSSKPDFRIALRTVALLCLSILLLLVATPVATQDEPLEQPEEAPPREAATLDLTISPRPNLNADLGATATVPVVVANNGNIPALGVVVSVKDAGLLEGEPVSLGDIPAGSRVSAELPVLVLGRSAFPLPFAVRATAANVSYASVATAEQSFAATDARDYLSAPGQVRVLLDRAYERFDRSRPGTSPLLWVELTDPRATGRDVTINLHRLLRGPVPADVALVVWYYPPGQSVPRRCRRATTRPARGSA